MTTTLRVAVELRDGGADSPGRLTGVLMRYGSPGQHGREVFAAGALRWPDNGIRIDLDHASSPARGSVQPPIMRAVPVVSGDGGEVRIDSPLPDTTAGPARGVSPLQYASLTGKLTANLEQALGFEAGGAVANLITLPAGFNGQPPTATGDDGEPLPQDEPLPSDNLAEVIRTARGRTLLPETTADNWNGDPNARPPRRDFEPQRLLGGPG